MSKTQTALTAFEAKLGELILTALEEVSVEEKITMFIELSGSRRSFTLKHSDLKKILQASFGKDDIPILLKKLEDQKTKGKKEKTERRKGRKKTTASNTQKKLADRSLRPEGPGDIKFLDQVGASLANLLVEGNLKTIEDISATNKDVLKPILQKAGPRLKNLDPTYLIEQAQYAHQEEWTKYFDLVDKFNEDKLSPGPKPK